MLTPAEELGLGGLGLASRVRKAFYRIPEADVVELMRRIREESTRRHLIYLRDGELDTIHVLPCPVTVLPDQIAYVHFVTLTIQNALKRLPELYLNDPAVREILRLTPEEDEWLTTCWGPSHRDNNPIFGRLDAMVDFTSPMWKDSLRFVEPNLSGIGGLHLTPTCDGIVCDLVVPLLQEHDPTLQLEPTSDIRQLLMQEILDHIEAIGRTGRNVCFVEPKYAASGPDEQEELVRYFHERFGTKVMHADPAELTLSGDEVFYNGDPVDLAYRDYAVADLMSLGQEGVNIEPMRALFRQNRVISSIAAELDQKACWEVLTDPELARQYFSADERQVFRRHILWTRLLADRRTLLPDGQTGPLLEYVRRERESLVLKPNRAYGGQGVAIGHTLSQAEWDAALDGALADRERWVVQQLASIPVNAFPVVDDHGAVHTEPFYLVMGFAPSKYGLAVLARASQKQVINVARRGGMCALLIGHPPARLLGPGMGRESA
jgi:hypothetical protein